VRAIADNPAPPTFENTMVAMEKSGQLFNRVMQVFGGVTSANLSPELQKVQEIEAPKLAAHQDAIFLDTKLFQRVDAIYKQRDSLGLDAEDLSAITARANDNLRVLGLRFTNDRGCPPERFETLRTTLGPSFEGIEIDSSPGNAAGIEPSAHSVLTISLVDEPGHPTRVALDRVLTFLAERLRG